MIVIGVALLRCRDRDRVVRPGAGSRASATTEEDFDDAFDELVAEGTLDGGDRAAAWRDFHAWQLKDEEERVSWEEPSEE